MDLQKEELNLGNLLNSITTPSPVLQVQMRKLYLKVVALCGLIIAVSAAMPTLLIPAIIVTVAKVIGVASSGAAAHSYTAKQDSSTQNTTTDDSQTDNTTAN